MVGTFELQVSVARFTEVIIQTLRQTPRPLPAAAGGIQVQRVRYLGASVRHDQDASFQVFRVNGSHDQGLGWEWITAKQVQLAVAVSVELTTASSIAAHVNRLAPPDWVVEGTLVFDLTCDSGPKHGALSLNARLSDLETPVPLPALPAVAGAKSWVVGQLRALLAIDPLTYDLSDAIPTTRDFVNTGLTVDGSGHALVLRAEISGAGYPVAWKNFLDGFVADRLGSDDWAAVLDKDDLVQTLQSVLWAELADAIGHDNVQNVSVDYDALGDRAGFTITPYVRTGEPTVDDLVGIVSLPIELTVSLDDGELVIDVDGSAAAELASELGTVLSVTGFLLVPFVGPLVYALVSGLVAGAVATASSAAAGAASGLDGLPAGTTVVETGTFRYRARIPFSAPGTITGRITGLSTDSEGVAIGGTWSMLRFAEGDLTVAASRFVRTTPAIACGSASDQLLRSFDADPAAFMSLYAQAELTASGTAPVSVDAVVVVQQPPSAAGVLKVDRGAPRLPATVALTAPGSLAGPGFTGPVELEVRTSIGVVRLRFDPLTTPVTREDVSRIRSLVLLHLKRCDAIAKPSWWLGGDDFGLTWVDPGLDDPDPFSRRGVKLTVGGLLPGLVLVLQDRAGDVLAEAVAGRSGRASVEHVLEPGEGAPFARIRVPADVAATPAYVEARALTETGARLPEASFEVHRTRWDPLGAVRVAGAGDLAAVEGQAAGHFVVRAGDEQVLVRAGAGRLRPTVEDAWTVGTRRRELRAQRAQPLPAAIGASAWLTGGAVSGDVVARATPGGLEFWRRSGAPELTPPGDGVLTDELATTTSG